MKERLPALDGVRGIAIALVLVGHFTPFLAGDLGVDLFFVLSGYLITSLLLSERDRRGSVSFRAFYERRARRLLPALAVLLVVLAIGGAIWDDPAVKRVNLVALLGAVFYVYNWLLVADQHTLHLHWAFLWTLSIEEQFYLIWPAVLVLLLALRVPRRAVAVGLGALVLADLAYGFWMAGHSYWIRINSGSDTHAAPLLAGCLLACLALRPSPRLSRLAPALTVVAGALGLVATWLISVPHDAYESYRFAGGIACGVVAGTSLLVVTLSGWQPLQRVVTRPWLCQLGVLSYAIYLWNEPVNGAVGWVLDYVVGMWWLAGVMAPTKVAITILIAWGSWNLLERRFLRRPPLRLLEGRSVIGHEAGDIERDIDVGARLEQYGAVGIHVERLGGAG